MTATLEWKGIPTYIIGIGRGISAGVGLTATVVYPLLLSRLSPLRTGLWSFWSQVYDTNLNLTKHRLENCRVIWVV